MSPDAHHSDGQERHLGLTVTGKFVLDGEWNPPPLKSLKHAPDGTRSFALGRNVDLRLGHQSSLFEGLLDARVVTSRGFTGLGNVDGSCAVICASNWCRERSLRAGRPRVVAKIVGVMADEPRFVVLMQPKLQRAPRGRHESRANGIGAGLAPFVLVEPAAIECSSCPGPNVGEVDLQP